MRQGSDRKRFWRTRGLAARVWSLYRDTLGTYRASWLRIFMIALVIFIPVGLLQAVAEAAITSLNPERGVESIAILTAAAAAITTGLLGEVFLAGVVGVSLADARDGRFPSLLHVARRIKYLRLILLDLLTALLTLVGFMFLILPGIALFVLLGLGGPVIEIEHRRTWSALRRSISLVRIDFWMSFWVLIPAMLVTGSLTAGLERMITGILGHGPVVTELGSAVSEAVFSPLFAIAAVLLTFRLIDRSATGSPRSRTLEPEPGRTGQAESE